MTSNEQLDRLATFEPVPYPVVSLYLNTQPDGRGKDHFHTFVRKEFKARSETFPPNSPDRERLERDLERITAFLENELTPSANGVAIFACSAADLFETVQLSAPVERHWLYIGDQPHLYPLARLESQYPRYAVVLADTNGSRIFVFARGEKVRSRDVPGTKTRRTTQGGWSQARFQRHVENFHLHHVKDVVDALDEIVRRDAIEHIVLAGDDVVLPLLKDQLPKHLTEKVVDEMHLPATADESEVIAATLEALRKTTARMDSEKVDAAVGAYRAGGLGVVGPAETVLALTNGQVDELFVTATLGELQGLPDGHPAADLAIANDASLVEPAVDPIAAGEPADASPDVVRLADELVTKARQTGARVTFIEDPELLKPYGGVAATLRYRA